ncbi:MAG: hypothetical protein K2N67_06075, partial [Mucispirillum sp.]|nr:hypothetical protein [Mucispirillum sp.]
LYEQTVLKDEETVLMIGEPLTVKYKNYAALKKYFTDIIPFNISCNYADGYEDKRPYFDKLLKSHGFKLKDFDTVIVAAAHHAFGIYLNQKGRDFIFMEDGAGMFSRSESLKKIETGIHKSRGNAAAKLGLFDGSNKYVKEIICDFSRQAAPFSPPDNALDFSAERALRDIGDEEKEFIIKFFLNKASIDIPKNSAVIFTEHFANLKIMSFEYQCKIYQYLCDYFLTGYNLAFKPHPDDLLYYGLLFKDAFIIRERFPAEILPYVFNNKPSLIAGISTTSIHNIKYAFDNMLSFDEGCRSVSVIDSFHSYYIALKIIENLGIYKNFIPIGAYMPIIDNMIAFGGIDMAGFHAETGASLGASGLFIMDNITDTASKEDIINILDNADRDSIAVFINSLNDICFYHEDRTDIYKHIIPIRIYKELLRENQVYEDDEPDTIYIWTKNENIKRKICAMSIEKTLGYTGIKIKKEAMTEEGLRIAVLEGILEATEKRLIHEIEKNKKTPENVSAKE